MSYRHPDFRALGLENAPDCRFVPAPKDATLPDGFTSTTNHPTYVRVGGRWRMPERPRIMHALTLTGTPYILAL